MAKDKLLLSSTIRILVSGVFILISMVVLYQPVIEDGLQLLFLLPLFFGVSIFALWDTIIFIADDICIILLLATMVLRYAVSPLLMSLAHSTVPGLICSYGSYVYAIVISLTELIAAMFGLKMYFGRKNRMEAKNALAKNEIGLKTTLVGLIAFWAVVILVVLRGYIPNVIAHTSVLLHVVRNVDDVYTFDMNCLVALKAIVFLVIANGCYQRYKVSKNAIWFIIACAAGVLNVIFYDYTQRALLMEIGIATVVVLNLLFPNFKKTVRLLFGLGVLVVISSLFLINTLHFDDGLAVVVDNQSELVSLSTSVEVYSNGITNMAYSLETYSNASRSVSISTFYAEIIKNLGFLRFPVLRNILAAVSHIPETTSIWHTVLPTSYQGFIIPPIAQANYYFTPYFGWIIDILYFLGIIKLMAYFRFKMIKEYDVVYKYIWTFYEILCSLCFCYNARIMLHTFTYIPMYILIIYFFNKFGKKVKFRHGGREK